MVVIKLEYQEDIRRVSLPECEKTHGHVVALVKELYAVHDLPEDWVLKYKDDDGDMVTVTCEIEFKEALTFASKAGILKLFVVPAPGGQKKPAPIVEAPVVPRVAHPAICDHCDNRIVGIRFKCSICPDYDLCETCENIGSVHDKSHCFLKIHNTFESSPVPSGRCPYAKSATHKPRFFSAFVDDVTIEDGKQLTANSKFVKVWRLKNNGHTAWPEGTCLVYLGGEAMSPVDRVIVPSVEPGQEVDISVEMVAPKKAGRYISSWRLSTPNGSRFGHRVWADIVVVEQEVVEEKKVAVPVPEKEVEIPMEEVKVVEVKEVEVKKVEVKVVEKEVEVKKVEEKKVDDDIKDGPFRQMLIELYDMGFRNRSMNRQVLVRCKGDLVGAVHELLKL